MFALHEVNFMKRVIFALNPGTGRDTDWIEDPEKKGYKHEWARIDEELVAERGPLRCFKWLFARRRCAHRWLDRRLLC